jgi:hypothetical protein
MEGEKMESHQKGFFKSNYFSHLKILTSHLFEETLSASLSLHLFSSCFFLIAPSLEDLGVLMIFEEKIICTKAYFQMVSIY